MIEEKNAVIESTMLGFEDHGIMTFMLHLNYGSGGQGAGGYSFDEKTGKGMSIIPKILKTLKVDKWENLKGLNIKVKSEHSKVHAIAHFLEDDWLDFEDYFREMFPEEN